MTDITLEKLEQSQKVETQDSKLVINMPNEKLSVGQHRFSLKVEDDSGNQSTPAMVTVIVVDSTAPTAVIDLLDKNGRMAADGRVEFGSSFILSGKRSLDIGGSVSKYIWEIVPQ